MRLSRWNVVERWPALLGAACAATLVCSSQAGAGPAPKVEICHIPPGNPDNAHTIRVSGNAVKAHLKHGDTIGPCERVCPDDCNDGNPCTMDKCDAGECTHEPVICNDGEECTMDSCNLETGGCDYVPRTGEFCTGQDDLDCTYDDGLCNDAGECVLRGKENCCDVDSQCADDDRCDFEKCENNVCVPNGEVICIPDDDCKSAVCDRDTGMCMQLDIVCDSPGLCDVVGSGTCNPNGGCEYIPITDCCAESGGCDDGDPCTTGECGMFGGPYPTCEFTPCHEPLGDCVTEFTCEPDTCEPIVLERRDCDDLADCTIDDCEFYGGCVNESVDPISFCPVPSDACSTGWICDQFGDDECVETSICSGSEQCNAETQLCESSLSCNFTTDNSFFTSYFSVPDPLPFVPYPNPPAEEVRWNGEIGIECESDGSQRSCAAKFTGPLGPFLLPGIAEICLIPIDCPVDTYPGTISCDQGASDQTVQITQFHDLGAFDPNSGACTNNPECVAACETYCSDVVGGVRVPDSAACEGFCRSDDSSNPSECSPDDDPNPTAPCDADDTCDELNHASACSCQCAQVGTGTTAGAGEGLLYIGWELQLFFDIDGDNLADGRLEAGTPALCNSNLVPDGTLAPTCFPFTTSFANTYMPDASYFDTSFPYPTDGVIAPDETMGVRFPCADGALTTASGAVLQGAATFIDTRRTDFAVQHTIECE